MERLFSCPHLKPLQRNLRSLLLNPRYDDDLSLFNDLRFIYVFNLLFLFQSVQENQTDASETEVISYASQIEAFKSLAGDSDASCLEEFINQINAGGEESLSPIILSPDSDKSHRTVSTSLVSFSCYVRFGRHMICY